MANLRPTLALFAALVALLAALAPAPACGRTIASNQIRVKRVSDQRLAELETLVGLTKMHGKLVTVPLALGKVDPKAIGRRRRSQYSNILLDQLLELSRRQRQDMDAESQEGARAYFHDDNVRSFLDKRKR